MTAVRGSVQGAPVQLFRAVALPPLRPAAFFCAVVPPCDELLRDELELLPPRLDAPGEFAIRAARSFDIPLSFRASYCFSFFTLARLLGMVLLLSCRSVYGRNVSSVPACRVAKPRRLLDPRPAAHAVDLADPEVTVRDADGDL